MCLSTTPGVFHSASAAVVRATCAAVGAALLVSLITLPPTAQAKAKDPAPAAGDTDPGGSHPVLDRIKASGRIVLAHRESSVPFSYYDADKKPVGYAIDLCKDVAEAVRKHLGLKTLQIA